MDLSTSAIAVNESKALKKIEKGQLFTPRSIPFNLYHHLEYIPLIFSKILILIAREPKLLDGACKKIAKKFKSLRRMQQHHRQTDERMDRHAARAGHSYVVHMHS